MNPVVVAYLLPAETKREIVPCILSPHPIDGWEDEVSYLPSMYARLRCQMVERIDCACVPNSCIWADEEAFMREAAPPLNVRASILAGREVHGDCMLAGDDGERTTQCKIVRPDEFFRMLNVLASTVDAVIDNSTKEQTDGRDS